MSVKKILMLVGDFVEDYEVIVPFQMLTMVGHTVHAETLRTSKIPAPLRPPTKGQSC